MRKREPPPEFGSRADEGSGITVMLADAGTDGEDIRIEDDVFGRKPELSGQQRISTAADGDFSFQGFSLAGLIKGHDDHGSAMAADQIGLTEEFRFTFFQ